MRKQTHSHTCRLFQIHTLSASFQMTAVATSYHEHIQYVWCSSFFYCFNEEREHVWGEYDSDREERGWEAVQHSPHMHCLLWSGVNTDGRWKRTLHFTGKFSFLWCKKPIHLSNTLSLTLCVCVCPKCEHSSMLIHFFALQVHKTCMRMRAWSFVCVL